MNLLFEDPTLKAAAQSLIKTALEMPALAMPSRNTADPSKPTRPPLDIQRQAWGYSPSTTHSSLSYGVGNWLGSGAGKLIDRDYWGDGAPWKGALQFGTAGAATGGALAWLLNQASPLLGTPQLPVGGSAALAGLIGSLLGGYRAHNTQQRQAAQPGGAP